jgi:hypothetical protein
MTLTEAPALDEVRERYGDYLLAMIEERYLPGIRERVIGRSIHSPLDIGRKLSARSGARSRTGR